MQKKREENRLSAKQSSFYSNLYSALYGRLRRYGMTICNSESLVEDCVQELFELFISNPARFEHVKDIQSYLFTSLRHSIFKKISHKNRFQPIEHLPQIMGEESAEFRTIQEETKNIQLKRMRIAISKLSEAESKVIKSRFFEEKSYQDIALENNSTKRTVYNQVHSGIKKLRNLF